MELTPLHDLREIYVTFQGMESGHVKETCDSLLKQILKEYHEFLNLFKEETGIKALP
jgi:hypothetical protein